MSAGIITAIFAHWNEKRSRTHEIKIQKYFQLIEELARWLSNDPDFVKLRELLNQALIFGSDEVVKEILKLNEKFTQAQDRANGKDFSMTAEDLRSLILVIRKDLYLKSKAMGRVELRFFQKPHQQTP